jgi:hypothetical protein
MGKSTERVTKESARHGHHASPFFNSGERRAVFFQPKLAVNTPDDHLEQEADRKEREKGPGSINDGDA